MFKLLDDTNTKENIITIQGKQITANEPVASILFQNYDIVSKTKYDLVALSCYDHHGDPNLNEYGDFSIRTKSTNNNLLTEKIRLHHNGVIQIGSNASSNALLNIAGDINVMSNITANTLNLNKINAQTKRIILKGNNLSDSILTLNIPSSNIQGIISPNILPKDVSFSNIETTNTHSTNISTTKLIFGTSFQNPSININDIYFFKDWTSFNMNITNSNMLSNIVISNSEYKVMNKNVDISTIFGFIPTNNIISSVSYQLPYGQQKNRIRNLSILYNTNDNSYTTILTDVNSNNVNLLFNSNLLQNTLYEISSSFSYVMI